MSVSKRVLAVLVLGLGFAVAGGCKTSQSGVTRNPATGSIRGTVSADPERATAAAEEAVHELGLKRVDAKSTAIDGHVSAYTARDEKVTVDIKRVGSGVSSLVVKAGTYYGDSSIGTQLHDRIQEKLGGAMDRRGSDTRPGMEMDHHGDHIHVETK